MRLALLLLASVSLWGQTIYFAPTQEQIGPYTRYQVTICTPAGGTSLTVTTAQLWAQAMLSKIQPATEVSLQQAVDAISKPNKWRIAADLLESGTVLFSVGDLAKAFKIGNDDQLGRWKAAVPIFGGILRMTTTVFPQPKPTVARDKWTGIATIAPGTCAEYSLYGIGGS